MNTRIVRGNRAWPGDYPWFASLHIRQTNNQIVYCGGAIINNNWILTSAQCVQNARVVQINAGSVNFRRPAVTINADAYFHFPEYNSVNYAHNLALVRISHRDSLVFANRVNATLTPIRLPALSQADATFQNQDVVFQGFGDTAFGK